MSGMPDPHPQTRSAHGVGRWGPPLAMLVAALAVVAPLLRPGYVLTYDMVFVPRQPWAPALVGLGSATARAVPSDLLVVLASHVVPGQVVQKAILLGVLAFAGWGAARLVPAGGVTPYAAGLAYLWSPFTGERLLLGQWPVLLASAALPWLVGGLVAVGRGEAKGWLSTVVALVVAAVAGPPGWILAALATMASLVVGGVLDAAGDRRQRIRMAGLGSAALVVLALPWAVPALLRPHRPVSDRLAAQVFAARADSVLGSWGSVLTGGGVWNRAAEPPGRGSVLAGVLGVLLLVLAVAGLVLGRADATVRLVAGLGILGLAVALASLVPFVRDAVADLPGGALLRDATRFLAAWQLAVAVGAGTALERLIRSLPRDARAVPWALAVLPVVLLPGLAWGVGARLHPVHYPRDFAAVEHLIGADERPGAVVVLPFTTYRQYPWNPSRPVLGVVPRWLDRVTVAAGDLPVGVGPGTVTVSGDDPLAAAVGERLAGPGGAAGLGTLGVRWVVVDAPLPETQLAGLIPRRTAGVVRVYEVPVVDAARATDPERGYRAPTAPVVAAGAVTVAGVLVALVLAGRAARATRRPVLQKQSSGSADAS
ncbi:MAG: hypothetical protein ABJA87_07140 [bacterium]